jgi:hypothetical protein
MHKYAYEYQTRLQWTTIYHLGCLIRRLGERSEKRGKWSQRSASTCTMFALTRQAKSNRCKLQSGKSIYNPQSVFLVGVTVSYGV